MSNILGLDLGTNSIGWAIRNPSTSHNQIEKFGVITFNKGVGLAKTGEYSLAAERTKKRSARRLYQSRKYRLWSTLEHLIQEGYCPLSVSELNSWRHYNKDEALKNHNGGRMYPVSNTLFNHWIKLDFNGDGKPDYTSPYQLRKNLAELKLDFSKQENRYKLGRALYHIAQRRGFKSSRKAADETKGPEGPNEEDYDLQYSEKKRNKTISDYYEKYPSAQTIGWLFALIETDKIRIRDTVAQYAIRQNYKDEIKYIFQKQHLGFEHALYRKLVESSNNKNDGSIFYKRPLRSQKGLVGKCTLEPSKYRAPISHPQFELFRAWSFINNIKYKPNGATQSAWEPLALPLKQQVLEEKFFRKSRPYFPFSEISELINKKGGNWQFNFSQKTTVTGCPVSARLKEIFGDQYDNITVAKETSKPGDKKHYTLEDIWHILFSCEDQEFVAEFAEKKLKLPPEKVKLFVIAWNTLPVGYSMLSLNAIVKINKFLCQGLMYTEAVLLANMPTVIGFEKWNQNKHILLSNISKIIDENRHQKSLLFVVNSLVSQHKSLEQKFGYKDNSYALRESDIADIHRCIDSTIGASKWQSYNSAEQQEFIRAVTDCYQAYFRTTGQIRKDIDGERYFEVISGNRCFFKADSGYFKIPKLIDTLKAFLSLYVKIDDKQLNKIYHPSEISIYPAAKPNAEGVIKLASPKTGSFKNPMAMRTLYELRRLLNYLIESGQIDSDTRVVLEVARELNDANKRWAIEAWQKQREAENSEFAVAIAELSYNKDGLANSQSISDVDKMRIWYEQNEEEAIPPISGNKREIKGVRWSDTKKESYKQIAAQKSVVDKYRLWKEQECQCIYTGKIINITDLFNENVIDFEHTIPRSISFDNSLSNQTVCYADYNRNVKKKKMPYQLPDYDAILARIEKWNEKVERIKQQIDFWKTKTKKATDKQWKDDAIRQRHLWQMELDYWKNKVDRFKMTEITTGFTNSQKVDTQLISKYAFQYLKSYFDKVDVQKGSITAEFRKIFGIQSPDTKKDRSSHSHHAKDAAVLTLIPVAAKRDEILRQYYEHKERRENFTILPYADFKREYIWNINEEVLINNQVKNQTLSTANRKVRKRGKEQFLPGSKRPMWATGDCIRGQLHQETFYGAIIVARKDEEGKILKDENGKIIKEEKPRFVIRVPFQYKKDANAPGFKTLEEILKSIVDEGLKSQIELQVKAAGSLKDAFDKGMYLLDKTGRPHGHKIRHIRVWASITEPLKIKKQTNLSKVEYKQFYYAANATNSFFAIYRTDGRKDFVIRNLMETAQIRTNVEVKSPAELFAPYLTITKAKKELTLPLTCVLSPGMKLIFKKDIEETVDSLSKYELLRRLYVLIKFEKDGRLNLKFHLEARNKIDESYADSEIDFDNPKPTLRFGYAKYEFLVEGRDFEILMDGTINWI